MDQEYKIPSQEGICKNGTTAPIKYVYKLTKGQDSFLQPICQKCG